MIHQGELYWVDFGEPAGSEPAYNRPCVVVQNNIVNKTAIKTVIVCVLTQTLSRARITGNVLLNPGEGGLPGQSVVNASQLYTLDQNSLGDYIGCLRDDRISEIISGIRLMIEPRELL